ncbi:hypothetical protein BDN72DRAFT_280939 [Pluteus cervinus]|uniref:Uncharacterized protein n=1 Tax=Pluteus cervinus TaxID=181527 RepID=A0ACD3AF73_9AGAR|nr:hypothetical protein BDN72DRAFT_280939 [Pluteus cervinus]
MVPSQELSSRLVLLLTFFLSLVGDAFATASLTQRSSSPSSCGTNGQSFPCEIAPAFVYPVHDQTRSSRCEPWENAVSAPECSLVEKEQIHPGVATFISGQSWVRRTRLSDNSTLRTVRSASTTGQWDVEILGDLVKTYLEEGRTRVQTTMSSLTQSTQQWLTAKIGILLPHFLGIAVLKIPRCYV